jgi:hypothetical protein
MYQEILLPGLKNSVGEKATVAGEFDIIAKRPTK